jgi:uncharacterized protein YecT (DUF1311 family)
MKKTTRRSKSLTSKPEGFPALTKAQRDWVAERKKELKAAIAAGIASGKRHGYRTFDVERILSLVDRRQRERRRAKGG